MSDESPSCESEDSVSEECRSNLFGENESPYYNHDFAFILDKNDEED